MRTKQMVLETNGPRSRNKDGSRSDYRSRQRSIRPDCGQQHNHAAQAKRTAVTEASYAASLRGLERVNSIQMCETGSSDGASSSATPVRDRADKRPYNPSSYGAGSPRGMRQGGSRYGGSEQKRGVTHVKLEAAASERRARLPDQGTTGIGNTSLDARALAVRSPLPLVTYVRRRCP